MSLLEPWLNEPDELRWTDEATGLECEIKRIPELLHLCGYVGVGPLHPWHDMSYDTPTCDHDGCWDHSPESLIEVHGNLTYGATRMDGLTWFGFDCAHLGDFWPGRGNCWPGDVYRDWDYVRGQVESLAKQLAAVTQ